MARIVGAFEQFFDINGDPLVEGKLYFYASGSTTPKNTFADVAESIANTNPVILSGEGRAPNIFGTGSFKVILTSKDDVQIVQRDPVGGLGVQEFGADWNSVITYQIGDIVRDDPYYYQGQSANNLGNQPSIDGGSNWITWPPNTADAEIYADEAAASAVLALASETAAAASETAAAASETAAAASEIDAEQAADVALAASNFKGNWADLTGALNVPASVLHDSIYWMLLVDLPDVTASEPGVTSDWSELYGGDSWGAPKTSNFNLLPLSSNQVDVSGGAVTATLPAVLQIGDSFTLSCFDSTESGNLLTIARNGHTILNPIGVSIANDLDLETGNAVQLVAETASSVRIVGRAV